MKMKLIVQVVEQNSLGSRNTTIWESKKGYFRQVIEQDGWGNEDSLRAVPVTAIGEVLQDIAYVQRTASPEDFSVWTSKGATYCSHYYH